MPAFTLTRFKPRTDAFAFFCPHSPAFARSRFPVLQAGVASTAAPPKEEFENGSPMHRHNTIRAFSYNIVCIYVPASKVIISWPALNTAENGEHNEVAKQMFGQMQIFQFGSDDRKMSFFQNKYSFSNFRSAVHWVLSDCCVASSSGSNTIVASEYERTTPMLLPILEATPCLTSERPMWNSVPHSPGSVASVALSSTSVAPKLETWCECHIVLDPSFLWH